MDKYLLQILHDVNTIIIPGLGALTVTNSKTGEIMFMSFLKHDDGNLSSYISEKEGISENDAKNIIAKYVREISAKLDKGESYDMYQFGRFIKVAGEIEFENWSKFNGTNTENVSNEDAVVLTPSVEETKIEAKTETAVDKPGEVKETIIEKKEETISEEEIVEEKALNAIENLLPTEEKETPKSIDEVLNTKEEIVISIPKTEAPKVEEKKEQAPEKAEEKQIEKVAEKIAPVIPVKKVAEVVKKTPETKLKQSIPSPKKDEKPFINKVKKEKEKKKRGAGFYVLISLIVLIVLGGASAAIFYDKIQETFFASHDKTDEIIDENQAEEENLDEIENQVEIGEGENETQETEEVIEKEVVKSEPVKEKPVQTSSITNSSGLSYHIIAGGFSSESNATRLAQKYSSEGKNACVLGKFDDLYLVAYQSFSSQEEAKSTLASSGIKGWIFRYDKK